MGTTKILRNGTTYLPVYVKNDKVSVTADPQSLSYTFKQSFQFKKCRHY